MNAEELTRLAELLRVKNAADAEIARLVGRPCQLGHVGEWIAGAIFDIQLHDSATDIGSDGVFLSGSWRGRSVNVKWYTRREGLDVHLGASPPDLYLVLAGPRGTATSSRGGSRPWVISSVYALDHNAVVAELRARGVGIGAESSLRRETWEAAEVYPEPASNLLTLSPEQRNALALFAPRD